MKRFILVAGFIWFCVSCHQDAQNHTSVQGDSVQNKQSVNSAKPDSEIIKLAKIYRDAQLKAINVEIGDDELGAFAPKASEITVFNEDKEGSTAEFSIQSGPYLDHFTVAMMHMANGQKVIAAYYNHDGNATGMLWGKHFAFYDENFSDITTKVLPKEELKKTNEAYLSHIHKVCTNTQKTEIIDFDKGGEFFVSYGIGGSKGNIKISFTLQCILRSYANTCEDYFGEWVFDTQTGTCQFYKTGERKL